MPICPFIGLMSHICPNLPVSAATCLRIGDQNLAQILSVYMKKIAGGLGWSRRSPDPQWDPRQLAHVVLARYN